jgi:hypothetical protein
MKTYEGVEEKLHAFLTSILRTGKRSASRPGRFISVERIAGTHYRWLGGSQSQSGRGVEEKKIPSLLLPGIESRSFRP